MSIDDNRMKDRDQWLSQSLVSLLDATETSASSSTPQLPAITVTEPENGNLSASAPVNQGEVESELLALIDDQIPSPPAFYSAPPVRQAAKKGNQAIGKVPTTTTSVNL